MTDLGQAEGDLKCRRCPRSPRAGRSAIRSAAPACRPQRGPSSTAPPTPASRRRSQRPWTRWPARRESPAARGARDARWAAGRRLPPRGRRRSAATACRRRRKREACTTLVSVTVRWAVRVLVARARSGDTSAPAGTRGWGTRKPTAAATTATTGRRCWPGTSDRTANPLVATA